MAWRVQLNSKVFAQYVESSLAFAYPQVYQKSTCNLSLWRYPLWFQGEGRRAVKRPLADPEKAHLGHGGGLAT